MMGIGNIVAVVMLWVAGNLGAAALSALYWGTSFQSVLNGSAAYTVAQVSGAGTLSLPTLGTSFWLSTLPTMLSWNYPIFVGSWQVVQLFLFVLTIGVIIAFFFQGAFVVGSIFQNYIGRG